MNANARAAVEEGCLKTSLTLLKEAGLLEGQLSGLTDSQIIKNKQTKHFVETLRSSRQLWNQAILSEVKPLVPSPYEDAEDEC